MTRWRYVATRLDGAGGETLVHPDLPLTDARILDPLSAAPQITGVVRPETPILLDADGRPVIEPWSTALYAEADGIIRAGGIVTTVTYDNDVFTVEASGFLAYPDGQGWPGAPSIHYEADPAVIYRMAWTRLQEQPGGNLGVTFDPLTTTAKVGRKADETDKAGGQSDEPFTLAVYATTDLGADLDSLLAAGNVEVRETHAWSTRPGRLVDHHVIMKSPGIGRVLPYRYRIGENVLTVPKVDVDTAAYASYVIMVGAGEGPAAIVQAYSQPPPGGRLFRSVAISRRELTTRDQVYGACRDELYRRGVLARSFDALTVRDTPGAPIAAVAPGDTIRVEGFAGWAGRVDTQMRVLSIEYAPQDSASATFRVGPAVEGT